MSFIFRGANVDNPMSKYITSEQWIPILELVSSNHKCLKGSGLWKKFIRFLTEKDIKGVKKDEWESIYYFFQKNPDDLENYSLDDAWPVLFDDFAEWIQNKGA